MVFWVSYLGNKFSILFVVFDFKILIDYNKNSLRLVKRTQLYLYRDFKQTSLRLVN
jgi:hypothetical protein